MKKTRIYSILLAILIVISLLPAAIFAEGEEPDLSNPQLKVSAKQYAVIDAESGQVLIQKNMNEQIHPASTVKIVTAALALNSGINGAETLEATHGAIDAMPESSSKIAIDYGEKLSLTDLIYALLLYSANDAANVLAESVANKSGYADATYAEKEDAFATLMNKYATDAGAKNTNFTNPSGIYEEENVSTAYDMAMMFRQFIKIDGITDILTTVSHTIAANSKHAKRDYITNGNLLVKNSEFKYDKCIGGKTGYTDDSGYSFVTAARNAEGKTYIVALYNCADGDSRFTDAIAVFDYVFNYFKTIEIPVSALPRTTVKIENDDYILGTATVYAENPVKLTVHFSINPDTVIITDNTPDTFGEDNQKASFTLSLKSSEYMENDLGTYPLTVNATMLDNPVAKQKTEPDEPADKPNTARTVILILLFVFLAALAVVAAVYIYSNVERRNKVKERREQQERQRDIAENGYRYDYQSKHSSKAAPVAVNPDNDKSEIDPEYKSKHYAPMSMPSDDDAYQGKRYKN